MGKLTQISWPQEYSELQRIEELLLCGICYDYMETSVMTPCSHNYCSLCIRKYLHYKAQCPACFKKTFEKDLHTNRIVDELITYLGRIRLKLVDCVTGAKIEMNHDDESTEDSSRVTPVRPARMNQNQKKQTPSKVETKRSHDSVDSECKAEKFETFVVTTQKTFSSPGTSGVSKMATIFTPKSEKNSTKGTTLPCPVCRVEISETNINKHLDDCLKREIASQEPPRMEPKRKPLPKLVFSLMKDNELRKKIKELGLPTQGDRKILESRFQRYSTLYNAECDKREPRPIEELLKQCYNEEALEKKMLKFSQTTNRLKVNRNTEQNVIDEAQKQYLESNKQNYQSLIATIKERENFRKSSVKRSLVNHQVDNPSSESSENHIPENNFNHLTEDEDLDRTSYSVNAYDAHFHDSDSDTSCPLQHYTSDDPISFLSIQMSSSSNSNNNSIQNSSKFSPIKTRDNDKDSLDTSASPAKNVTLSNDNNGLVSEKSSRNEVNDILDTVIDTESNDEDAVTPSPKSATNHTKKRAKLSLRKTPTTDNINETKRNKNKSEGKKLALSIARDFTFDTSSNESVGFETTHETVRMKSSEKPKVETRKVENIKSDLPKVDKENHEASTTSTITVDRPLRKRNCITRTQSTKAIEKSKDIAIVLPNEVHRTSADERENSTTRIDSPVKRRRRRKIESPVASESKNPPSRPLRKRNSVIKDNIHQRP